MGNYTYNEFSKVLTPHINKCRRPECWSHTGCVQSCILIAVPYVS